MVKLFGKTKEVPVSAEDAACESGSCTPPPAKTQQSAAKRLQESFKYAFGDFVGDIAYHFILGLIIAALITVLIPADFWSTSALTAAY